MINQNYNISDGSNSSSEMTKQTAVISTNDTGTDSSTQRRRRLLICNLESQKGGGQAFTSTPRAPVNCVLDAMKSRISILLFIFYRLY